MELPNFVVIDVKYTTPTQLEEIMNGMHERGYKRVFQSNIDWYQGKGESGIITFELKEE
jgi:hypothetical protein